MSKENIQLVIAAGVEIAQTDGIAAVTASAVARATKLSRQTIHNNFVSSNSMRNAVFAECVKRRILPVIAELIILKHPIAESIPKNLRAIAIQSVE